MRLEMKCLAIGVCAAVWLTGCGEGLPDANTAGAEVAEPLPAQDLRTAQSSLETASDFRFRQANRYAGLHGYAAGYGNFHEADYGAGRVRGTILLKPGTVVAYRDVYDFQLGGVPLSNIPELFRQANNHAWRNGYAVALPTFEQRYDGWGVVYGINFLNSNSYEPRSVPVGDLGYPDINDAGAMMRAANDYAVSRGYAAGLPTFHAANYGGPTVYGLLLFYPGTVAVWDVFADVLATHERFNFEGATVTNNQRARLLLRHEAAFNSIHNCPNLSSMEKFNLKKAYRKVILHHGTTEGGNARAEIGGDEIWINFDNLFPWGDTEISQTLIHEMMHIAGYTHPDRRDTDVPGDNGAYYGSAPLRAEFCIAGTQSLHSQHTLGSDQLYR